MICKVLKLVVNTLTAHDKYSLPSRDNLTHPIQTQLSNKQKGFHEVFSSFLKFTINLKHFQRKENPHNPHPNSYAIV